MLRRALIVIAAYALSMAGGAPFMLMGAYTLLLNESGWFARLVPLVWVFAWVTHVRMSLAWIRDETLPGFWPRWGTVAGVFSLASPVLLVSMSPEDGTGSHVEAALITSGVVAVFLSPAILLAIALVRYHQAGVADDAPARRR